ncbi:MAG: mechanosensitive ion channel [Dissulfuribacterales bacterium]
MTHIGLRTSRIRTFDDNTVTIPNGMFLNKAVSNANSGKLAEQIGVGFSLPGHMNMHEIYRIELQDKHEEISFQVQGR